MSRMVDHTYLASNDLPYLRNPFKVRWPTPSNKPLRTEDSVGLTLARIIRPDRGFEPRP